MPGKDESNVKSEPQPEVPKNPPQEPAIPDDQTSFYHSEAYREALKEIELLNANHSKQLEKIKAETSNPLIQQQRISELVNMSLLTLNAAEFVLPEEASRKFCHCQEEIRENAGHYRRQPTSGQTASNICVRDKLKSQGNTCPRQFQ